MAYRNDILNSSLIQKSIKIQGKLGKSEKKAKETKNFLFKHDSLSKTTCVLFIAQ